MPFGRQFFDNRFFPAIGIPFAAFLEAIFFPEWKEGNKDDYPIHGPNVVRLVRALFDNEHEPGLLKEEHSDVNQAAGRLARDQFEEALPAIRSCLGVAGQPEESNKMRDLLSVAALYHDIGKAIRRANHPQIGANLIRSYSREDQQTLVENLRHNRDDTGALSPYHRFSLVTSIVQHHDKFGVVSTGEGALPIFSDILYFTSNETTVAGVKKNITSVMLVNLADIAAVSRAPDAALFEANKIAGRIRSSRSNDDFEELIALIKVPEHCLGVTADKMRSVLADWATVVKSVDVDRVLGNRVALKLHLLDIEKNPARTIERVRRLLREACDTALAHTLESEMTHSTIESVLVSTLGAHQFQVFCEQFAAVAKLDYALNFFKHILCDCVRQKLVVKVSDSNNLAPDEVAALNLLNERDKKDIAEKVTMLFVRVLETLVARYTGVLDHSKTNPRRFGFQMRNLTEDKRVRATIIDLLCRQHQKEPIALTWIADEATVWSLD